MMQRKRKCLALRFWWKNRRTRPSIEPIRNHSINDPGPSETSLVKASNPAEHAGIAGEEALCSGFGERNNAQRRGQADTNLGTISIPPSISQKNQIQRKKNRIPERLTKTLMMRMQDPYHTPHSAHSFSLPSLTIGNRAKRKFPQTRRHLPCVGSPVL